MNEGEASIYGSDQARIDQAEWEAGAPERARKLNELGREAGRSTDIAEEPESTGEESLDQAAS